MKIQNRVHAYKILGISTVEINATDSEIKNAYKNCCLMWHPDKNSNSEESHRKFIEIQNAYEFLSSTPNFDSPDSCFRSFSFPDLVSQMKRERQKEHLIESKLKSRFPDLKLTRKELKLKIKSLDRKRRVCDVLLYDLMQILLDLTENK